MSDQRDLASEVEYIREWREQQTDIGKAVAAGVFLTDMVDTLLASIDLQREAIKWCLDRGAFPSKTHPGAFEVPCETDVCDAGTWEPPKHLAGVLEQALGSKA